MILILFLIFVAQLAIIWNQRKLLMAISTLADLQPHLDALKAAIDSISKACPVGFAAYR